MNKNIFWRRREIEPKKQSQLQLQIERKFVCVPNKNCQVSAKRKIVQVYLFVKRKLSSELKTNLKRVLRTNKKKKKTINLHKSENKKIRQNSK